jgi:glycerol kinase
MRDRCPIVRVRAAVRGSHGGATSDEPKAVMALDQGTTSSRAMVFGHDGTILGAAQQPLTQYYPRPGWVEHDPEEIWQTQLHCGRLALRHAGLDATSIAAIGIANQRETVVVWDAGTGAPLGNAVVWQCRRTADRCAELERAGHGADIERITGLRLDPYFSASKIEWLLANIDGARELALDGRLRVGTIDSFLVWRLTGGKHHVTDYSNASRTMLLDLDRIEWSDTLLDLFHVPRSVLPSLCLSSGVLASTDPACFGVAIPLAGIAGDQQAALFGQAAVQPGDCKNTYGTGCFLLMNVGNHPAVPGQGLVSTVAWVLAPGTRKVQTPTPVPTAGSVTYALEGSIFMGGGAAQWLAEATGIIESPSTIGPLAAQAADNGGVYFVPALTGLGAPYWDPYARGLIIGLTRGARPEHLARATEEAICFQTRAVLDVMEKASHVKVAALRADGGAAGDDFLLQLQSDLLGVPVIRPRHRETTALGAAALAGLAVGFWSEAEIGALAGTDRVFTPSLPAEERERVYSEWRRAVERSLRWES